jgi:formate dehydrogenase major subunit
MVNITINGKVLEVTEGTTVLRAAQAAGIDIPTLCDHPHLTPYGGCRLCLVEVEGARTLQPSCTLPVSNNMVVKTDTKKVLDARTFVLTLLFSERNHFCPYCQVTGGDCELQNAAYHEGMTHWPLSPNYQPYPMDASHPYIIMENNRCILCRRCVRACGELIGNYTLGFEERGAKSILVADTGIPLGESSCISCGSCVQVCPTGALIDRWSAYRGKETQVESTKTICVGCSLGCGINVLTRNNSLVRIEGDWDAKMNEGVICEIGRFTPMNDKCDRIATPLIRKNGALKAATWDEALSVIASQMKSAPKDIAAIVSTRQPVETIARFKQVFIDRLGSDMVTSSEEGQFTRSIADFAKGNKKAFEGTLSDLKSADSIMVFNEDLIADHQVAGFFIKRVLSTNVKLLVVDSLENGMTKYANKALKPSKGTKTEFLHALSAAVAKLGLEKGKAKQNASDLKSLSEKTGLSTDDFLDAAYVIASSEKPVIIYSDGSDVEAVHAFAEHINAKVVSVKGNANSLAASLIGIEKELDLHGKKVLFIANGDEELSQKSVKDFEKVPFKAVQSAYSSSLTSIADVVLPSTEWLEQEGHYISSDGMVNVAKPALIPAEEILSPFETLGRLAEKLGVKLDDNWTKLVHERVSPVELSK